MLTKEQRIPGGLWGSLTGDALGVPGGLAGVLYGMNAIPPEWVQPLACHGADEAIFDAFTNS